MPVEPSQKPAGGLTLDDVYFTIFRHKGKILLCTLAGAGAAVLVFLLTPPSYQSQAKLFVRYVSDTRPLNAAAADTRTSADTQVKSPDSRGETIINNELQILTSADLALQVVDDVGPQKVLARLGGGNDRYRAAGFVRKNLIPEGTRNSSVILVTFQHPDPEIAQQVLRKVIDRYLEKHSVVHRAEALFDDFLTKETDRLRNQLAGTEADLQKLKTNSGVLSIEDARRSTGEEMSRIRQELYNAEAELAERAASLKQMELAATASPGNTNQVMGIPSDKLVEHRDLTAQLGMLRTRRNGLRLQFTAESDMIKVVDQLIADGEQKKRALEEQYPTLVSASSLVMRGPTPGLDPAADAVRITALQAKMSVLSNRLETVRAEALKMEEAQTQIGPLQRQKELEENRYRYYSGNLEQARIDETLGAGKLGNINEVQAPSAPSLDRGPVLKIAGGCLGGGLALGLVLAFLLERFLDPTVRRPIDLVAKSHLPLILSVPRTHRNGGSARARGAATNGVPATEQSLVSAILADTPGKRPKAEIAAWDADHHLRPYHEALRDRLMTYFEMNNLTHKPKLVGLAGCLRGSGVTTFAAGLAATLSETSDGNVLLVDMNQEQGAAHPFFKGRPTCDITDSLADDKRGSAMIQDRLYMAAANPRDRLPNALPIRFSSLVPKLKASDYDYIIFDMPPITSTSVTPRLARFMDMMLLVVESEKTSRDLVKQASALLSESKANVHTILNKSRKYTPGWLQQEL